MTTYRRSRAITNPAELGAVRTGSSGGVRLYGFVRERARVIVHTHHYSPRIYAREDRWSPDAIDELAQDVFAGPLYGEGQYRYAMDHANDLDHFRGLIDLHIRRTLGDRVERTIVGNLGGRGVKLMEATTEFASDDWPGHIRAFWLLDRTPPPEHRYPSSAEIGAAAVAAAGSDSTEDPHFARIHPKGRAGPGGAVLTYSHDQLHEVLVRIGTSLPCLFRRRDIEETFALLLGDEGTEPFLDEPPPGDGESREAGRAIRQQGELPPAISPSAFLIAGRAADAALGRMSPRAREVLCLRLDEDGSATADSEPSPDRYLTDVDIAEILGCDRKTVAKARTEASLVLREEFAGLPEVAVPLAVEALIDRIVRPAD